MLEIKNISKKYDNYVLNDVSFDVQAGEIMAIVGSNGSGKTTLMKIICGLISSTSGSYSWKTDRITNMIENPVFFDYLSGYDNLRYFQIQKGEYDKNKIDESLKMVNLFESRHKKYKKYSLGMKQKLAIALCLIGEPDFLVLDEPTNGIDAEGIISIRTLLKQLNISRNVTMLISSHNLHELYNVATSFCFIKDGRIKEISTKDKIQTILNNSIVVTSDNIKTLVKILESLDSEIDYKINGDEVQIFNIDNIEQFKSNLKNAVLPSIKIKQYDIEGYFLNIMGGNNE